MPDPTNRSSTTNTTAAKNAAPQLLTSKLRVMLPTIWSPIAVTTILMAVAMRSIRTEPSTFPQAGIISLTSEGVIESPDH